MNRIWPIVCVLALSHQARAQCTIPEETKQLDPVEVGFCESDAVFVGRVEQRIETARGIREEGSDRTVHIGTETSTVRVLDRYKGTVPDKVTMVANLYDRKAAFSFEKGKEYLVFAKRRSDKEEYTGASAACSVQPTLAVAEAQAVIKQLQQHRKGRQKIDCKQIRPRSPAAAASASS